MFDTLYCKYPLPQVEGVTEETEFQTKDFNCALETYIITPHGTLLHRTHEYEEVPEEERPYFERGGIWKVVGSLREVNEQVNQLTPEDVTISFYTVHNNRWIEYEARFIDGYVQDIKLVHYYELMGK